ncbi:hypothetical protein SAMD00019534_062830 [Acytostelium subglobosum LB1]|uniref:hypothetical protein n=1 Tax=Acytostelium subglobosum LB1 TaxID=1410327 RepID=UPI000644FA78|nr:hypothetical protein SAMD00019534_062830 [Acytostelium subglobosum LB1]GAM23108.1 hypothetical protein SAMD00019534_062830 [Acytostelium subglobosum LB1]|eukprot:XP_012754335.1 hypothetical protein SAMD00019534_062830 [Acytostelium subglobosum LB1]
MYYQSVSNVSEDIGQHDENIPILDHTEGVQLVFRNIVYKVPNKQYSIKKSKKQQENGGDDEYGQKINYQDKDITILHGVSGVIERGELVGLMGPSGSGKSTLLDILAERKSSGTITGSLLVNGKEIGAAYKNYCAYVTQEDILLPTATVEETLRFHADLRLPHMNDEYKRRKIQQVLDEIGLSHRAKSKIGGLLPGGIMLRGLSGGEKRRVSIGCGLVTNPSLIFLDEPTSGLDSVNALIVMRTLMRLTDRGVTVVCSIHQPRQEIWKLFTKVMVVVKGHMIYSGGDIVGYLNELGYPMPPHVNPADFCLDTAVEIGESTRYPDICNRWKQMWEVESNSNAHPPPDNLTVRPTPSWLYQYRILLGRVARDFVRNPGNCAARTVMGIIIGLLGGSCFGGLGYTQLDIPKILGLLFFLIVSLNLMPYTSIALFLSGKALFNQERASKLYHPFPYFLALLTMENVVVIMVSVILPGICYSIAGLSWETMPFALLTLYVVHLLSDFCVIAATNITGTSDHSFTLGSGFSVIFILFSGFFVPASQLPKATGWIHWVNPLYYTFTALIINEFQGKKLECIEFLPCPFPNGDDLIAAYGLENYTREEMLGIAAGYTFLLFVISYLALAFLHKERR